ncbi:hypothetical protein F4775DRAFT_14562 [Biscogniauxia sp. FL1348]|nr:hypothetical protein F4775DRAFT_14562 [Biscogniauxia sp. FL1348]
MRCSQGRVQQKVPITVKHADHRALASLLSMTLIFEIGAHASWARRTCLAPRRPSLPHPTPELRIILYEYNSTAFYGKDQDGFYWDGLFWRWGHGD